MEPQNKDLTAVESLIEELSDESLAACVGGCGWVWSATGNECTYETKKDGDVKVTQYWMNDKGKVESSVVFKGGSLAEAQAAGLYYDPNGSVRYFSDRAVKEQFSDVDAQAVLDRVAALPITTWQYKGQETVRHIGPMAQDFAAAFNVGTDDRSIHAVDANGVALAAIQALHQMVQAKDVEINRLRTDVDALKQLVNR